MPAQQFGLKYRYCSRNLATTCLVCIMESLSAIIHDYFHIFKQDFVLSNRNLVISDEQLESREQYKRKLKQ